VPAAAAPPDESVGNSGRFVEIARLGKTYATPTGLAEIVPRLHPNVGQGEFICIVGHSGCGKSTVLSIVMGLNQPTTGGVVIGGREVSGPGTDRGVVFQSATLLPWLSVRDNVRLSLGQVRPRAAAAEAEPYLAAVGLAGQGDRYPRELSAGYAAAGGHCSRLRPRAAALLLDEPFSLLDALTRMDLQDQLMTLWEAERKTVIMVTHDVDEALLLADRIVMMTSGPAATVGEILAVPFPRPRRREEIVATSEYFELRDAVVGFLEERAAHV
jgi:ABC-type nitrate/sulfonate/bicarbonate transport system, ATPase component